MLSHDEWGGYAFEISRIACAKALKQKELTKDQCGWNAGSGRKGGRRWGWRGQIRQGLVALGTEPDFILSVVDRHWKILSRGAGDTIQLKWRANWRGLRVEESRWIRRYTSSGQEKMFAVPRWDSRGDVERKVALGYSILIQIRWCWHNCFLLVDKGEFDQMFSELQNTKIIIIIRRRSH